jgi:hypothetical protein
MRNSSKLGIVTLAIAVTALACDPAKTNNGKTTADSLKKSFDTSSKAAFDTVKNEQTKKL